MFGKKKKKEECGISYDEVKDTYNFEGHGIHSERLDSGRYLFDIDGRQMYISETEFKMMFLYFSLMYRRMDE